LRNAKLRFSRKLILMTGMLACFSWRLRGSKSPSPVPGEDAIADAIAYFESYLSRPPLEILADELLQTNAPVELGKKIFSAYDEFLSILDDPSMRDELVTIPREVADKSFVFQKIRTNSHEFRDGLLNWLFIPGTQLYDLVKQYAIF